jgi:hypothetical protein
MNEVFAALSDAIGTPSVSLDADKIASVRVAAEPEGERVPTGVGGLSQVIDQEGNLDEEDAYYDDDYASPSEGKPKRSGHKPKHRDERTEMTEKEREKEQESEEKNEEKQQEKGWDTDIEKKGLLVDIGPSIAEAYLGFCRLDLAVF